MYIMCTIICTYLSYSLLVYRAFGSVYTNSASILLGPLPNPRTNIRVTLAANPLPSTGSTQVNFPTRLDHRRRSRMGIEKRVNLPNMRHWTMAHKHASAQSNMYWKYTTSLFYANMGLGWDYPFNTNIRYWLLRDVLEQKKYKRNWPGFFHVIENCQNINIKRMSSTRKPINA